MPNQYHVALQYGRTMKTSDYDYFLPTELIAQQPLDQRSDSRLLVLDPQNQTLEDRLFKQLTDYLHSGDLLVFNDTRVFPARLFGNKHSGGKVEVLVERILDDLTVKAHLRSSKSPRAGTGLLLEQHIQCRVVGRDGEFFMLELQGNKSWLELLQLYGHIPLPPYIEREDEARDHQRYQTVYANKTGAVAAPTAGLHFDQPLIDKIKNSGVDVEYVTLHVGAGTFQPVRVDDVSEHVMHAEWIEVNQSVCDKIRHTKKNGGRVIAVGTTVVRSLESAAQAGGLTAFQGDTRLFITPGFQFKAIDAMITNFHLPKSTLLMLVSAFAGKAFIFEAYRHAVEQQYRFFSYGDAMLITSRINDRAF